MLMHALLRLFSFSGGLVTGVVLAVAVGILALYVIGKIAEAMDERERDEEYGW